MATIPDRAIGIVEAEGPPLLDHVRDLFRRYAGEFAGSIAESLCFQGFAAEQAGLPGRYAPPGGCLLLAMGGDRPAGCVAVRDRGDGTCEMKRLYLVPGYRGRGLGRRLVEEALDWAGRQGYRRMVLDTLLEMGAAIAVDRSLGFAETGRYGDNPIERSI